VTLNSDQIDISPNIKENIKIENYDIIEEKTIVTLLIKSFKGSAFQEKLGRSETITRVYF